MKVFHCLFQLCSLPIYHMLSTVLFWNPFQPINRALFPYSFRFAHRAHPRNHCPKWQVIQWTMSVCERQMNTSHDLSTIWAGLLGFNLSSVLLATDLSYSCRLHPITYSSPIHDPNIEGLLWSSNARQRTVNRGGGFLPRFLYMGMPFWDLKPHH